MKTLRNLAFVALAIVPFASQATPSYGPLGLASAFNAFVFGNTTFNGNESEGSMASGGNFTYNAGYNFDANHIQGPTIGTKSNVTALIGGNLIGNGDGHLQYGNAYVGGDFRTDGHFDLNALPNSSVNVGGSYLNSAGTGAGPSQNNYTVHAGLNTAGNPLVPASLFTDQSALSRGQSSTITGYGATFGNEITAHTPTNQNDQNRFQATNHGGTVKALGDQNGININVADFTPVASVSGQSVYVFDIDKSLVSGGSLVLNWNGLDATKTVLVNVTGGGSVNWGIKNSSANLDRVLYNFGTATSLSIGSNDEFHGSILAPLADVTATSRINGNLVAANATFSGTELHIGTNGVTNGSYAFGGYAPQAVPEPGAWAALGLSALAALRRRRR